MLLIVLADIFSIPFATGVRRTLLTGALKLETLGELPKIFLTDGVQLNSTSKPTCREETHLVKEDGMTQTC